MHRQTVYPQAASAETDLLWAERFAMVGLGYLAQDILGSSTAVIGALCGPTTPTASLAVVIQPGRMYSMQVIEATTWSSLPADTTPVVKQGLLLAAQTIALPNICAAGQSVNYLIEGQYQDVDTNNAVLSYYNSANIDAPFTGPGNTGTAQSTVRKGSFVIQAIAGTPAATGTQTNPAVTSGYVPLYIVTIAYGATAVVSANIAQVPYVFNWRTNATPAEIKSGIMPVNAAYGPNNVKRYGAAGDGAVNDTTAVQNAITVALAGAGVVYFPPGTYLCGALSGTILNASSEAPANQGLTFYGSNMGISIVKQSGTPTALLTLQSSSTSVLTEAMLKIEDLSFQGTGSGGSATSGISLKGIAEFTLRNVYSCGFYTGVNLNNSLIGSIQSSLISNNQYAMQLNGASGSPANIIAVENTRMTANTTFAVYAISGSGIRFYSCDFEGNGTAGNSGTGAFNIVNTIASGFGGAIVSLDNCWFESNLGGPAFVANLGSGGYLSFKDTLILSTVSGNDLSISGSAGSSLSIDNCYMSTAAGSTSTINAGVYYCTIKNSLFTTLNDSSTYPIYENVFANAGFNTWGRVSQFTYTLVGFSGAAVTGIATAQQQGGSVTLTFAQATGTSSGTTMQMNGIPSALQPSQTVGDCIPIIDNGSPSAAYGYITGGTSSLVFGHTFVGSGTKGIPVGRFSYNLSN